MRGNLIWLGIPLSSARSGSLALTTAQPAPLPTSAAVESAGVDLEIGVSSSHLPQPPADSGAAGVGSPEQNSCLHIDMSLFARGFSCGSPLSKPCFDFGRCGETPSVYVYDSGCSLLDSSVLLARDGSEEQEGTRMNHHYLEWIVRKEAKEAGLLAERYESACLFMHVGEGGRAPCPVDAPLWDEGSGHLMIDMSDDGR